jgi:hypothetical protein
MDKYRIEGGAEEGEQATDSKVSWSRFSRRKSGGCAGND